MPSPAPNSPATLYLANRASLPTRGLDLSRPARWPKPPPQQARAYHREHEQHRHVEQPLPRRVAPKRVALGQRIDRVQVDGGSLSSEPPPGREQPRDLLEA